MTTDHALATRAAGWHGGQLTEAGRRYAERLVADEGSTVARVALLADAGEALDWPADHRRCAIAVMNREAAAS